MIDREGQMNNDFRGMVLDARYGELLNSMPDGIVIVLVKLTIPLFTPRAGVIAV